MTDAQVPARLRERIARDLRPVRPLAPPWQRSLALAPVAMILVAIATIRFGLRADLGVLASAGWGLSTLEALVGLAFVALALTDAIPGRTLPRRVVLPAFAMGVALVAGVTLATMALSPTVAPPEQRWFFAVFCLEHAAVLGVPAIVVAAALVARALPLRPLLVGALYGFGAGLFADSGWRLFCSVSAPSHVFLAHGGAIALLTILGAVTSQATASRHRR